MYSFKHWCNVFSSFAQIVGIFLSKRIRLRVKFLLNYRKTNLTFVQQLKFSENQVKLVLNIFPFSKFSYQEYHVSTITVLPIIRSEKLSNFWLIKIFWSFYSFTTYRYCKRIYMKSRQDTYFMGNNYFLLLWTLKKAADSKNIKRLITNIKLLFLHHRFKPDLQTITTRNNELMKCFCPFSYRNNMPELRE